jgi:glycosyltransferase involved in cell wall biosynthesis
MNSGPARTRGTVAPVSRDPSIAIAHEWLAARAGAEKVFETLAEEYPSADLYALTREPDVPFDFGGRKVKTTFLDTAALRHRRDLTLPLMPLAWRLLGARSRYDTVITSSLACVKGFAPARAATHYCYCHAPMRYAWQPDIDTRHHGLGPAVDLGLKWLRRWDRRSADWVDFFAANSTAVQQRIRDFYDREAEVIHPPVDTEFFTPPEHAGAGEPYVFAISRFIAYKRTDLAIEAATRAGLPVVVAGSGPLEAELRATAERVGADARFEIQPSDERLRELYRGATVLVFPALEDLGMIPVEAQACGTPVVGLDEGGTRDTVVQGETGLRVQEQTVDAFTEAIQAVAANPPDPAACRAHAETFSREHFKERIREWVRV